MVQQTNKQKRETNINNNTMNKKRKIIKSGETKPRKKEKLSYQSVDGKSGCIDCPVCLEETMDNIILKCKHGICYNCFNAIKKNECPICREDIDDVYCDECCRTWFQYEHFYAVGNHCRCSYFDQYCVLDSIKY